MKLRNVVFSLLFLVFAAELLFFWLRGWWGSQSQPRIAATPQRYPANRACADLNELYQSAKKRPTLACFTSDGIARETCTYNNQSRSLSALQSSTTLPRSKLQWDDALLYVMLGASTNLDALMWWLPLLDNAGHGNAKVDIVFIGDACAQAAEVSCDDAQSKLLRIIQARHRHQKFSLIRVFGHDSGYDLLSCKLRTGVTAIYKQFPRKKIYFKIDTDTVVMPRLLLTFLQALDAAVDLHKSPIYFGTVLEGKINLLLCGWERAAARGDMAKGGLCYAQGGAGYGLSNVAMRVLASATKCNATTTLADPEDMFTATVLYNALGIVVMHCSSFTSGRKSPGAITYHYLNSKWLKRHSTLALSQSASWTRFLWMKIF